MNYPRLDLYNGNLVKVDIIDEYISLIWHSSLLLYGDFELMVKADETVQSKFQVSRFLIREDTGEAMIIMNVKIKYTPDEGYTCIITGRDLKYLFYTRYNLRTNSQFGTTVEQLNSHIYNTIYQNAIGSSTDNRNFYIYDRSSKLFGWSTYSSSTATIPNDDYLRNVGEIVDECLKLGYFRLKITKSSVNPIFVLTLEHPTDRQSSVVFGDRFKNVISSEYTHDIINMQTSIISMGTDFNGNKAYVVAGDTQKSLGRVEAEYNYGSNVDIFTRSEIQEILGSNCNLTAYYDQLTRKTKIYATNYSFPILSNDHLAYLQRRFSNSGYVSGNRYYPNSTSTEFNIGMSVQTGDISSNITDDTQFIVNSYLYHIRLFTLGNENLYKNVETKTTIIEIDNNVMYKYNSHFYLGDTVGYIGINNVLIPQVVTESVENWDSNGYNLELTFSDRANFGAGN